MSNGWIIATLAFLCVACVDAAQTGGKDTVRVAFQSPGKAGAPISIENFGAHRADVGVPNTIVLRFRTPAACERLAIEISGGDGLYAGPGSKTHRFDGCGASPRELRVEVTPERDGRHYLNVTATMLHGGAERMRSFAVPIDAGNANAAALRKTEIEFDENGEPVRVMRAAGDESPLK